jgi:hypothetical protein
MTLARDAGWPHSCNIAWEEIDGSLREVHRSDPPGTVRRCDTCGKHWVAVEYPEVTSGMQGMGVFWRPEKRRERWRRERAARGRRMPPPPSVPRLEGPPAPGRGMVSIDNGQPVIFAPYEELTLKQPAMDAGQPVAPVPERDRAFAPHCDASVLHAPSACQHCDHYPDWQELRDLWRINYTGEHDPGKAPCPSEHSRTAEIRDRWPGNRAYPA